MTFFDALVYWFMERAMPVLVGLLVAFLILGPV